MQLSPPFVLHIRGVYRPVIPGRFHHPRRCRRDNLPPFRFAVRSARSPRLRSASRHPFRFSGRWSETIGRLPCRYSRYGINRYIPRSAPLAVVPNRPIAQPPPASRLPPRPSCRGARRRPFPRVVSIMWIARFIYMICPLSAIL